MQLAIAYTKAELNAALATLRKGGARVALVPTMGALHEGHMELIRVARAQADKVVVYIFVNPRQFGPNEDFARYPRPFEDDMKMLQAERVDLLYAPDVEDVYPQGYSTVVSVGALSAAAEGAFRPGFFDGVATVLAKMFIRVMPDAAVFGEKDYQQLAVVRRMVADLDLPVEILAVPTRREESGLARASRNAYLTPEERQTAPFLYTMLNEAAEALRRGEETQAVLSRSKTALLKAGFTKVDYLELRDAHAFFPLSALTGEARLLVAAWLGTTRLIDNIPVFPANAEAQNGGSAIKGKP